MFINNFVYKLIILITIIIIIIIIYNKITEQVLHFVNNYSFTFFYFIFSFRYITLFTPSVHGVQMSSAFQPISESESLSSRTWMATRSGGWGRQKEGGVTSHPTTSANLSTHELHVWTRTIPNYPRPLQANSLRGEHYKRKWLCLDYRGDALMWRKGHCYQWKKQYPPYWLQSMNVTPDA